MIYSIIFLIPVALWLLYKLPFWEASRDHAAIEANGSADTLHGWFHFWRGARRGVIQGVIVCAAVTPLVSRSFLAAGLLAGGLGVGGLAWFFIVFNTKLSLLRGLDPYYLSADPRAALVPDRLLRWLGWGLKPVLQTALWVGLLAALILAAAALYVASRPA